MARILILLDSVKWGHWRSLLNMSIQEWLFSVSSLAHHVFLEALSTVNLGHGWSLRREHVCLFLLFTPFLSELTVEVISVHLQDVICWHCLNEWRQTFVSFRTPQEFDVVHHNPVKRWLPEVCLSSKWRYKHRSKGSISSTSWKVTGRPRSIPSSTWE